MTRGVALSLCDRTGIMVEPWLAAGYSAITVDLKPSPNPPRVHRHHIVADVTTWRYPADIPRPSIVFAFPPCSHLAVSGARWMREKGLRALIQGLAVVEACREICEALDAPYMIENPVSTLSTYWRDPDFSFDPCDYGDPYTKRTCLWVGGGFIMPPIIAQGDMFAPATQVEPTEGSLIYKMPDTAGRADARAMTPPGFATAVFQSNGRVLMGTEAAQ